MKPSCRECESAHIVKNGRSRHGHQRFRCMACKRTFGETNHRKVDEAVKRSALQHYAEGVGLRATERLVGTSHNAIMRWVRQEIAGKALAKLDAAQIEYVEADELWRCVGSKKQPFGCGGLLIALPAEYPAGRWAIVTPEQPERWARRFLAALTSSTEPITGAAAATSSRAAHSSRAKPTRTPSSA